MSGPWHRLAVAHGASQRFDAKRGREELVKCLRPVLARDELFVAAQRLTHQPMEDRSERIHFAGGELELPNASMVSGCRLSIEVVLRRGTLSTWKARISGTTAGSGAPWYLRAEDDGVAGRGACSHPICHVHVGSDPGRERDLGTGTSGDPKVRVPLPPLAPWDVLAWMLATLYEDCEPAPWTHVVENGQTIEQIALRYGLEVSELAAWNGLGRRRIKEGETLRLHRLS